MDGKWRWRCVNGLLEISSIIAYRGSEEYGQLSSRLKNRFDDYWLHCYDVQGDSVSKLYGVGD